MNIYPFKDYRAYIKAQIQAHKEIRGYQGKLADVAKCQKPYFSNVLSGKVNLSAEQAMRLTLFWQLLGTEADYFLELVNLERTDFQPLKARIKNHLSGLRAASENLSKRIPQNLKIDAENSVTYYSSWVWSAIHILAGVTGYHTVPAIAERLHLSPKLVQSYLSKLEEMGLVKCNGEKWATVSGYLHLSKDSSLNSLHHLNWRQRAVIDSQLPSSDGVHFTCVQSHSHSDFLKLKDLLLEYIDKHSAIIAPSENEELTSVCIDFFKVT